MAVSVALVKELDRRPLAGKVRERIVDVTWDGAYPALGEPLTAATLGLTGVLFAYAYPTGGYVIKYNIASALLEAWEDNNDAASGPMQDATGGVGPGVGVTRMYVVGW